MPCYSPIKVWRGEKNKNGKSPIVFSPTQAIHNGAKLEIPCGKCIGCRLERARQWAIRLMHEKQLHDESAFITLTYDDDHLPKDGSLNIEDFQKFMKRLRKKYEDKVIRFFQCGEYGTNFLRPHHHACIFGVDFRDSKDHIVNDLQVRSSDVLRELWPFGFNTVGDITFESASYVARYIVKKVSGKKKFGHYTEVDKTSGEILSYRRPEYITMSRRPGIGAGWYDKYKKEVYPSDSIIMRGKEMKPPKYYDRKLEIENPELMKLIKEKRMDLTKEQKDDNVWDRLKVKEKVVKERAKIFSGRKFENE